MTQLFSKVELKPTKHGIGRKRRRRRIPTGAPRLMESSAERTDRLLSEAWMQQLAAIDRSSQARLELLKQHEGSDLIGCPWARLTPCDGTCRCQGLGKVKIALLRDHYAHLVVEIVRLVTPRALKRFSA